MPERDYKIYINELIRICKYFYTNLGDVLNFVVKLECNYKNEWHEAERYDCYHGYIHKDILDRSGKKKRTVKIGIADKKTALNFAIADYEENYNFYIWRFTNDKK
jgi:hypothetical protein